jgi:tripartite ATP-independent transporter DctM subunit
MITAFLGLVLVLFLSFIGVPLGLAMLLAGIAGFAWLRGVDASLFMAGQTIFDSSANYGLSVLPMFILMGVFIHRSDIADELYSFANSIFGSLKGSLAQATVGSCAMFGMLTGSSIATAATMSKIAVPPMRRLGYSDALSTGCVASAGVLGMLIPPSVPLIIFGMISDQDILLLFKGAIGPGILVALLFALTIWLLTIFSPHLFPQEKHKNQQRDTRSLKTLLPFITLFLVTMGGMYGGVFTVTEAAGIGAFGAFVIALLRRKLTVKTFVDSMLDAAATTSKLFVVIMGAVVFGNFINMSGITKDFATLIESFDLGYFGLFFTLMLVYLVLGAVMETIGVMILTVPVLLPIMSIYGVDLLWFGVFVVMMVEIGMLSPPIGINVFTVSSMFTDIPLKKVFRGTLPFMFANILAVVAIVVFPDIVMAPIKWLS